MSDHSLSAPPVASAGLARPPTFLRRYWVWPLVLLLGALLPWLVYDWSAGRHSGFVLSMTTFMAIMMIFAMSYNILMGNTGLLSFGHAVFYGLGGYCGLHVMNLIADGPLGWLPTELVPLAGGLGAALFGVAFAALACRQHATAFAMITLGMGELFTSAALTFQNFFGGESGISSDRTDGWSLVGARYAQDIEIYYLALVWAFVSIVLMYLITKTPQGRMANACRDNPLRAQFVGYDPARVRFGQIVLAAFFAGIAGSLFGLKDEAVTFDALSGLTSANALIMAFIGGVGVFFGPMIGAVVLTLLMSWIGQQTTAWLVYLGVLFIVLVLFAPGGIGGLIMAHQPLWQRGRLGQLVVPYLRTGVPALVALAGFVTLVELITYLSIGHAQGKSLSILYIPVADSGVTDALDAIGVVPWLVGLVLLGVGGWFTAREGRRTAAALDREFDALKKEPGR